MDSRYGFYRAQIGKHSAILWKLRSRIHQIGTLRLLLIIGAVTAFWILRNDGIITLLSVVSVFMIPFIILVVYHNRLFCQRDFEERIIELNNNELKALDYDFSAFDGATEEVDGQHSFSLDLDVFGENSLFQSVNRTTTKMGRKMLVDWFKNPSDNQNVILERQKGVKEMAGLVDFRQKLCITGRRVKGMTDFTPPPMDRKLSAHKAWKVLIWLLPTVWILLIVMSLCHLINGSLLMMYAVLCLMVANIPSRRIQKLYHLFDKADRLLNQYAMMLEQIENEYFVSDSLQLQKRKLYNRQVAASKAIQRLSRNIGALNQRYSLIGLILNALYMRDTRQAMKLEHWWETYGGNIDAWFDVLGTFEAYCSLGNFSFNHPDYVYPSFEAAYFVMDGRSLGHPLLHRDKCVRNDVLIPFRQYFLIVTGANMAGKSTYLRTVGVNFLLACIGAPVCAEYLKVCPAHLVTSLRTADSLASNESYFFAELKRLKMMIDRLEAGEKLFIILDEILKGTNSADKQKGSMSLMNKLIRKGTCGIIATHDLLLGKLADLFPDNVRNKCFEADIEDNKLSFTYKIREGVAQNMNATFMMRNMGISDE